jgi:hypothetical protein
MWRRTLPLLVLLLSGCSNGGSPVAPEAGGSPDDEPSILQRVAAGGYVLFFRHAERDGSAMPTDELAIVDNAGTCRPGSELTEKGIADALALRDAFARLRVPVGNVYASPTCRTTQMATLMFGRFSVTRALTWPDMWLEGEEVSLTPSLRSLLGTVPASRRDNVLVSHSNVLQASRIGLDVALGQGDAAVFRPLGGMRFEFIGTIPLQQWVDAQSAVVGYNAAR